MTGAAEDELLHLQELAAVLQRRRRILEVQRTRFGDLVPASLVMELEDTERQLAQIHAEVRRLRPGPTDVHSPYLGLITFQEDDSSYFFGRDALIGELLNKAEQTAFLAVLGPSGSGKSSVVRAGLIPALRREALPGSEQWQYLTPLKPGARPLNALAATLAAAQQGRLGDIAAIHEALSKKPDALLLMADGLLSGRTNARLVLVVDQAEELWTLAPIEPAARTAFLADQQQPFINCLLAAAQEADHPVLIILTLRADFLHRALEHHELASWIKTHNVLVEPMTRDELHSAITRPTELVGGSFEPGLVDTLVEQTISQPGALPLLEYTLLELWKERRSDGTLTWDAFKAIGGGVEGGLARRADTVLAKQYTPEQQAELRAVLMRLVQPGEGTVDTRRRVAMEDLVPAGSSVEAVQALLKPLADERLITTGYNRENNEEIVEVSHEALIRAWPTLGAWIATARGDLRLHIQLGEAARDWIASGENPDLLWSGLRLANTEAWLERARPRLNARDQRFIEASRAQRQAQIAAEQARTAAEEAARQRELDQARALAASAVQLKRRAMYLGTALVTTLLVAAVAGWFWYSATIAQQRGLAQNLVAQGQAVYEEHPLLGMRLVLEGLAWLPQDDPMRTDVISTTAQLAKQGRLEKLVSDGVSISSSPDNAVFILKHRNAPSELRRADGSIVTTFTGTTVKADFSPDSQLFIMTFREKPNELWRSDGRFVTTLAGPFQTNATFSPDSQLFVMSYSEKPSELRRTDGSLVTTLTGGALLVVFSPDSQLFYVTYGDKPTELRRADGSLVPLNGTILRFHFSPDNQLFLVSIEGKPAELRRIDGSVVTTLSSSSHFFRFSPDSQRFVVSYADKPAELRRADGSVVTTLSSSITYAEFSSDSQLLFVSYGDKPGEVRRADGSLVPLSGEDVLVVFSPDGQLFYVRYGVRPAELRRADGSLVPLSGTISGVTFSPDNQLFVVGYQGRHSELRRADGSLITTLTGGVEEVTFSPDNSLFLLHYFGNYGELWEKQGTVRRLATITNLSSFAYDPESRHLFVQQGSGEVYKLDVAWLGIAASYPATFSERELITQTCGGPLAGFKEQELQPYLDNRTPKACR
jgi:WD40 repeat protein